MSNQWKQFHWGQPLCRGVNSERR